MTRNLNGPAPPWLAAAILNEHTSRVVPSIARGLRWDGPMRVEVRTTP
jgi:hypothetical protein